MQSYLYRCLILYSYLLNNERKPSEIEWNKENLYFGIFSVFHRNSFAFYLLYLLLFLLLVSETETFQYCKIQRSLLIDEFQERTC